MTISDLWIAAFILVCSLFGTFSGLYVIARIVKSVVDEGEYPRNGRPMGR